MSEGLEFAIRAVLVGAGATMVMDLWAIVQRRVLRAPGLDYALVGRWIGHMRRGRFAHAAIGQAESVKGERVIGWTFHYATGVVFAAVLLAAAPAWAAEPSLLPALAVALASLAAPFLIMQPALGLGLAASRAAKPNTARLRSLVTHLMFGLGLYLAGLAADFLWPA